MKKLSILILFVFIGTSINAQTAEELKKEQAPKKAKIAKLQGEVNALQAKIFFTFFNCFFFIIKVTNFNT